MIVHVAKFTSLVRARDKFPELQALVNDFGVSSVKYLDLEYHHGSFKFSSCINYPSIFLYPGDHTYMIII